MSFFPRDPKLSSLFNKMVGKPFDEKSFREAAEIEDFKRVRVVDPGKGYWVYDPWRVNAKVRDGKLIGVSKG